MSPEHTDAMRGIACPYCHADRGEPCIPVTGGPGMSTGYTHLQRREAYLIKRNGAAFRREHA